MDQSRIPAQATGRQRAPLVLTFLAAFTLALSQCAPLPTAAPDLSAEATSTPVLASVVPETPTPARPLATSSVIPEEKPTVVYGYTYQLPDGNRLVAGHGALPELEPVDLPLVGEPLWLVAAPLEAGSVWAAVMKDGRVQAFRALGKAVESLAIEPAQLPAGTRPLLKIEDGVPGLVIAPSSAASPLSHPVVLDSAGRFAFIEQSGDLVVWQDGEVARLALNALPDARLLLDEAKRLLLLTNATTRYGHGVLGDKLEAGGITLVETKPVPQVLLTISLPEPQVVEGVAPIWADLDGDGGREIIVTASDAEQGAQLIAFDETGERIAAGQAIGRGYRWRHQLAVAPFGPEGEMELADVLTPHLGGIVEFYQMAGATLTLVAEVHGYSSHVLGSRNLDMALAGDLDDDGRVELLLPSQERIELGGIRRTATGAEVAWTIPLGGEISTNLAAVTLSDGSLAVGVGRKDGVLRLWLL